MLITFPLPDSPSPNEDIDAKQKELPKVPSAEPEMVALDIGKMTDIDTMRRQPTDGIDYDFGLDFDDDTTHRLFDGILTFHLIYASFCVNDTKTINK